MERLNIMLNASVSGIPWADKKENVYNIFFNGACAGFRGGALVFTFDHYTKAMESFPTGSAAFYLSSSNGILYGEVFDDGT